MKKLKLKAKRSENSEHELDSDPSEVKLNVEANAELDEGLSTELMADKKRSRKRDVTTLGLVTVVCGVITILFSLSQSFSTSAVINPVTDSNIHVEVTITSSQFSAASSSDACAGSGSLAGISNSTLLVTQNSTGLSQSLSLGKGSLTQDGSCLYSASFTPPANFKGGKITGSIKFPFGTAPSTSLDVGNESPFAKFAITINLS
jgi:hypothetical protein